MKGKLFCGLVAAVLTTPLWGGIEVESFEHDDFGAWTQTDSGFTVVGTNGSFTSGSYLVSERGWVNFRWKAVLVDDETQVFPAQASCSDSWIDIWPSDFTSEEGEWHTARVPVAMPNAMVIIEINAPYDCCSRPGFGSSGPLFKVIVEDMTFESAENFATKVHLELCGGSLDETILLGMNESGGRWYEDPGLLQMVDVNAQSYQWSAPAVERMVNLQWGSSRFTSGARVPVLRIVSQDGSVNSDEMMLLKSLAATYSRQMGGTWLLSLACRHPNVVTRFGQYGELPVPVREGCTFLGWKIESCCSPRQDVLPEMWLPLVSDVTVTAYWDVPLDVAADPTASVDGGISFPTGNWSVQTMYGTDGKWAGECVHCNNYGGDAAQPVLTADVTGAGVLTLPISAADSGCRVKIDGNIYNYTQGKFELRTKGAHHIEIVTDSWLVLLPMRWEPAPDSLEVTFDARGGQVDGASSRFYSTGEPYGTLPTASRDGYEFMGWFDHPDGSSTWGPIFNMDKPMEMKMDFVPIQTFDLVSVAAKTLYARWRTDLKTAIGGNGLRFATKDQWEGTSDISHGDGFASAGAKDFWEGKTNVMTTVVQGPGLLSFWWMRGDDFSQMQDSSLSLWLDGVQVVACADPAVWQHMTFPVLGRGNHLVEWKFTPGNDERTAQGEHWMADVMGQMSGFVQGYQRWMQCKLRWEARGTWNLAEVTMDEPPESRPRIMGIQYFDREPCRPGAWVDEVAWTPVGEVTDLLTWAKGVAEGHGWLTNALPVIEAAYTARMAEEPTNYELPILRAFTKLAKLGENENLKALVAKFGFVPDYQILGRVFGELDYYDAPLMNEVVDAVTAETVPTIESALADLELIPTDWTGSILLNPAVYPVDVVTSVDLADVTLCKAALKGALAACAVAESYDLSIDYMNVEMEALLAHAGYPLNVEDFVMDHPDLMKRVRDAERLAEGKELLRDALRTLQDWDRLMLARTSREMHFFEYDPKDAEKQQFARDEVAKGLTALDGTAEVNDDDFCYWKNYRLSGLHQSVTLSTFFAGDLTRRYLPTKINGNVPVFDSFPTMNIGGMAPGLTKETVAGWALAYGRELEYTPESDYTPKAAYRNFSAAIPQLGLSATREEIDDALAGTTDAAVRENVTDARSYSEYERWASRVSQSANVSLKAIKAAPHSWLSYALATPELVEREITDADLKVEGFAASGEKDTFEFTVGIEDVEVGSQASVENLKRVLGLEGATTLDAGAFSADKVDIEFAAPENGKVKFKARPNVEAQSFFMKVRRNK